MVEKKRDEMAEVLREVGLEPIIPDAGYFMMADTTPLGGKTPHTHHNIAYITDILYLPGVTFNSSEEPYDFQFAKWMTREKVR